MSASAKDDKRPREVAGRAANAAVREQLDVLLGGGQAHLGPERILEGVAPARRAERPAPDGHSCWELLEHLRLAQEDILRYTFDPSWRSPEWPAGYWPRADAAPDDAAWEEARRAFLADLAEARERLRDPGLDLAAPLPHGEGRIYLRQFLLIADHNAYHLGQVVLTRKLLGDWPASS